MKNSIHHVAISTNNYDSYVSLFTEVFEMTARKSDGEAPARRIWFHEGIQINEAASASEPGKLVDHIAIGTDCMDEVIARAIAHGCTQIKSNWIQLPDGLKIELMED